MRANKPETAVQSSASFFSWHHMVCYMWADDEQGPANSAVDQQRNRVIAAAALKDADPLAGQGEPPTPTPHITYLVHFLSGYREADRGKGGTGICCYFSEPFAHCYHSLLQGRDTLLLC